MGLLQSILRRLFGQGGPPTSGPRSRGGPPKLRPQDIAVLPLRPPAWPVLPVFDEPRPAVADREYARHDCPHCGVVLDPLPKAKKRCPSCGQAIYVKSGPDNRRYLFRADERQALELRWAEESAAVWEARERALAKALKAAGIASGEGYLDVVGESHYLPALIALVQRYPSREAVAELQREPSNPYDKDAVRVLIDGVLVGYLGRDDAEEYQRLLRGAERRGRPFYVVASLRGGQLDDDGLHWPVGVELQDVPEPGV